MGIISDFFLSTPEDAHRYLSAAEGGDELEVAKPARVECGGLTNLEVGILWAILAGEKWDVDRHDLIHESTDSEEGPWLFKIPLEFVQLLATASESRLEDAAVKWAASEELSSSVAELESVASDLHRLARLSLEKNLPMYFWMCL